MRVDVITIFEEMFSAITEYGITSRALKNKLWSINCWNPRAFTHDLHKTVDDRPFGGGPGMILMAEPLAQAVEKIRESGNNGKIISFSPTGKRLEDADVKKFAEDDLPLVFVCGRYEGIDQRFLDTFVDETYSIGDYVLSGGELPAMVMLDAIVRRLPGAIKDLSATDESFSTGLLDAPHYTRPERWRGQAVPEVLMSGHHENIKEWTRHQALQITATNRPELIKIARSKNQLSKKDEKFLELLLKSQQVS